MSMPDSPPLTNEPEGIWGESLTISSFEKVIHECSLHSSKLGDARENKGGFKAQRSKYVVRSKKRFTSQANSLLRKAEWVGVTWTRLTAKLLWPTALWMTSLGCRPGVHSRQVTKQWVRLAWAGGSWYREYIHSCNLAALTAGLWRISPSGTKQPLSSQAAHRWKGGNTFLPSPPTCHAGSWISRIFSEPPACLLVSGQTSLSLDELHLIPDSAFTNNSLGLFKGEFPESTVAIPKPVNSDIFLGLFHPAKHSSLSEFKKSISGP